ncbi:MAG: anion transporter [Desulfomonilia bacterium]|jgi:Na+/H+ antiporter NhaD/arsenite permease-like protein|nr:anion transporter [Deltaproteobacteria bacterium]MDX9762168.1 anion transporter [Desulfomonilia bacterium]
MAQAVVTVFIVVYIGMLLGRLPRLQLDRTGVALLGAIALIAGGALSLDQAARSIDLSTITLLFAFMVISAQLRLGGFYTRTAEAVTSLKTSPSLLLAAVILLTGVLSAVFMNDIVCLALPPVLIQTCRRRRLDPVPYLLAVACAANVGSAATLIGNPQNILIGQTLRLSFSGYLVMAGIPSLLGLAIIWAVITWQYRARWRNKEGCPEERPGDLQPWNGWESCKALFIAGLLFVIFLFTGLPRDISALAAAGLLLMSRKLHSRTMLGLVDWQVLVLFCGLFIVNHALAQTGVPELVMSELLGHGIDPAHPGWLFSITILLSNAVSNVPATMLLLPVASHPLAGPVLALSSTFAGNLLIVGSIANIIVVESAAAHGIRISWRNHAPTGAVVTALTLAAAALTLWLWPCT